MKEVNNCSVCKPFGYLFNIRSGSICVLTGKKIKLKHRYKVGDTVRVISNLTDQKVYDNCRAVSSMVGLRGKTVTITKAFYNVHDRVRYRIGEDRGRFIWSDEMFE